MALARSGQITVTTAGTAVQGTDNRGMLFAIKAHPDNADTVWVGNDGADDITSSNAYPLDPGETIIIEVANLNSLYVDADSNGDKVCWLRLDYGPY